MVSLADTIANALQSITSFPSRLKTGLRCWMTYMLWRVVLWMTPTFWAQLCTNLVSWCWNLPSRARKYMLEAFISISKGSVQLLWNCSFALCTTVHAMLIVLLTGSVTDSPLGAQVLLLPCLCIELMLVSELLCALISCLTMEVQPLPPFSVCAAAKACYQASHLLLQATLIASPDISNVLVTMGTNNVDSDSVHSEGSGPLTKALPSGSPTTVLNSSALEMHIQYSSNEVSVPQVCCLTSFMVSHAASFIFNLTRN